jgi:Flp pilus assembly protein TadG
MRSPASVRNARGSVAIEYAMLLPALLLFMIGIMEVGRLIWTQATLDRAVEAAARCGAADQTACADAAAIANYAATQAFGLTVAPSAFTASSAACGVSVRATFAYKFLVPWVTRENMTLRATACYPLAG